MSILSTRSTHKGTAEFTLVTRAQRSPPNTSSTYSPAGITKTTARLFTCASWRQMRLAYEAKRKKIKQAKISIEKNKLLVGAYCKRAYLRYGKPISLCYDILGGQNVERAEITVGADLRIGAAELNIGGPKSKIGGSRAHQKVYKSTPLQLAPNPATKWGLHTKRREIN